MEYYAELKLRKDAHNGGFSNGLTLCGSESTRGLERILKRKTKLFIKTVPIST